MGNAKTTRKFGAVKRLISSRDARLKKNKPQENDNEKKQTSETQIVRQIPQASSALFFQYNTALVPPYSVLVDSKLLKLFLYFDLPSSSEFSLPHSSAEAASSRNNDGCAICEVYSSSNFLRVSSWAVLSADLTSYLTIFKYSGAWEIGPKISYRTKNRKGWKMAERNLRPSWNIRRWLHCESGNEAPCLHNSDEWPWSQAQRYVTTDVRRFKSTVLIVRSEKNPRSPNNVRRSRQICDWKTTWCARMSELPAPRKPCFIGNETHSSFLNIILVIFGPYT